MIIPVFPKCVKAPRKNKAAVQAALLFVGLPPFDLFGDMVADFDELGIGDLSGSGQIHHHLFLDFRGLVGQDQHGAIGIGIGQLYDEQLEDFQHVAQLFAVHGAGDEGARLLCNPHPRRQGNAPSVRSCKNIQIPMK